jgi:hypothetical protein
MSLVQLLPTMCCYMHAKRCGDRTNETEIEAQGAGHAGFIKQPFWAIWLTREMRVG